MKILDRWLRKIKAHIDEIDARQEAKQAARRVRRVMDAHDPYADGPPILPSGEARTR